MKHIRPPYLIQRLEKPLEIPKDSPFYNLNNVFSFGCGLDNGGISEEGMKHIRDIWRYDYMGSSEFEHGLLAISLDNVADNIKGYAAGVINVTARTLNRNTWSYVTCTKPVYYICEVEHDDTIRDFICNLGGNTEIKYNTLEYVGLAESICEEEHCKDKVGWHDIKNHYLFFTDKTMFAKACELFGLANTL